MLNTKVNGYISAVAATMFMGSLGIFVKNMSVDPAVITFFRLFLAAFFILALMLSQKGIKKLRIVPPKSVIFSGVFVALNVIFYVTAIQRTTMSNAAFLLYLGPVFASLAAFVFLKESFTGIDIFSLFLSVLGILFMIKFDFTFKGMDIYGNICAVLSGFAYGMAIFTNRTIKSDISLNVRSFYQFAFGSLIVLPFAMMHFDAKDVSNNIIILTAMAFVCGFLGITLMFNAIKRLLAVEYGVLSYLEMFFAVSFGVIFFQDKLGIFNIIGGVLIVSAGLLQVFKERLKRSAA